MQRDLRRSAGVLAALVLVVQAFAGQTSTTRRPPTSKHYCHPSAGFCFRYPSSWTMLGDVFDGNGVVIAPAQKEDRALWDVITVAMISPPTESGGGRTLNGVVDQATSAMRDAGQNFQTLQRQERTVDNNPAQMLKTRYRENATGRDWVEELVFIEGPDNEVYSVGLKCAPEHLARLESRFNEVLASWTVQDELPTTVDHVDTAPPPRSSAPGPLRKPAGPPPH